MSVAYKYKEAAERLSVSEKTIRRLVSDGKIGNIRIGRSVRIPEDALKKFVTDNTRMAESTECRSENQIRHSGMSRGRSQGAHVHDLVKRLTSKKQNA